MMNTWMKQSLKHLMATMLVAVLLCGMFCSCCAGAEEVATATDLSEVHVAAVYLDGSTREYIGDVMVNVPNDGDPYVSIAAIAALFEQKNRSIEMGDYDFSYGKTRNTAGSNVLGYVFNSGKLTVVRMAGAPKDMDLFIVMTPTARVESEPVQMPVEDVQPEEEPTLVSSEPVEEPTVEPEAEPVEEPTTESEAEPVEEPTTDSEAEPVEAPTTEPEAEPVEEPTTEPEAEPVEEPTTEPEAEPVEEPTTEPEAESTEEPDMSPVVEPGLSELLKVECRLAGEPKACYYFGDEVGFEAVLIAMEDGFDPSALELAFQWQLLVEDGTWMDIEGANEQVYLFPLTEENYQNYYRVAVSRVNDEAAEGQEEV